MNYQQQQAIQAAWGTQNSSANAAYQADYQRRVQASRALYATQHQRPRDRIRGKRPDMYGKSNEEMRAYFRKNFANNETTVREKMLAWLKGNQAYDTNIKEYDANVAQQNAYDAALARMEATNYGEAGPTQNQFGNDPNFKSYINQQLGIDYGDNDFDKLFNTLNTNYGGLGTV